MQSSLLAPAMLAALLLAPLPARSDDFLKKDASGVAKAQAKADPTATVGKVASKEFQKSVLDHALEGIAEQADKIALFINDNGCRIEGGKKSSVTGADVLAKAKQIAPKIEVIVLSDFEMKTTFTSGGKVPWAAGMCGEGRATNNFPLPGKKDADVIVLRTPDGKTFPIDKLMENMPAHTLAHELLHILLTQFGNPGLGGGAAKADCVTDKKVANNHHRLTHHLYWGLYGAEWTEPATAPACN